MFVTDVVGGRSQVAHRTVIERPAHAGDAASGPGARDHLLILPESSEADVRWGWCCRGGEARCLPTPRTERGYRGRPAESSRSSRARWTAEDRSRACSLA